MTFEQFKKVLANYSESKDCFLFDTKDSTFTYQSVGELVGGVLKIEEGNVYVYPDGLQSKMVAEKWIEKYVAKLDLLAKRIREFFGDTSGKSVGNGYAVPSFTILEDEDILEDNKDVLALCDALNPKDKIGTNALFVTADAGEGKTTVVERIAVEQADRYLRGESTWILLPVELRARSLEKYDEVVVATLFQQLKFRYLFYEAFLGLVKTGTIVPALDGAEEMFVQRQSGDEAVSELGTFIKSLESAGSVLVSARRAYFSRNSDKIRARLSDSVGESMVVFERWDLKKWSKKEFVECASGFGLEDGEKLYMEILGLTGNDETHPFLTRAVLASKIIRIVTEDREGFLTNLVQNASKTFGGLVDALLNREVMKWPVIGAIGSVLLSKEEHEGLLATLAEEMWCENKKGLTERDLIALTEMYCDSVPKELDYKRQILKRINQHAFLVEQKFAGTKIFSFEHEDFFNHFVAVALSRHLVSGNNNEAVRILEHGTLPDMLVSETATIILSNQSVESVKALVMICEELSDTSYAKENASTLILQLVSGGNLTNLTLQNLLVRSNGLSHVAFTDIIFDKCIFQRTDTESSTLFGVTFMDCEFDKLEVSSNAQLRNVRFTGKNNFDYVTVGGSKISSRVPGDQLILLSKVAGVTVESIAGTSTAVLVPPVDERVIQLERVLRLFTKNTQVNEDYIRAKLGKMHSVFFC